MSKAVHQMFHSIARRYDVANDVLSFGIHRLWRRAAVKLIDSQSRPTVLDLCCGTGDMALAVARKLQSGGTIVGLDFVYPMLVLAQQKYRSASLRIPIQFLRGDALHLPFPDQSFDVVTIAFGIRNVDHVPNAIHEMQRVLRPNGRIIVLEFGQPTVPGFATVYQWYSRFIMPILGSLVTRNREAYEYLPETAKRFPAGERFAALLRECGVGDVHVQSLFGGIAFIYSGLCHQKQAISPTTDLGERVLCQNP